MGSSVSAPAVDLRGGIRSCIRLSNGVEMPRLGLGVWQLPAGSATREAVGTALRVGYRLIDTATLYGNEREVGEAVRASGIPRKEIFVTTKVWNADQSSGRVAEAFDRSEQALGLGPIDLYLLHWPVPGRRRDSWGVLRRLLREGRCRSIGVSNFTIRHLEELLAETDVVPMVNQVEFSPFLFQRSLLEYCERRGIAVEAYAPLTRGERLGHPVVQAIAAAHNRSPAQILLRWALQHGLIVIPKSSRPERIRENAQLFDFDLAASEMGRLDGLDEGFRTTWDPSPIA